MNGNTMDLDESRELVYFQSGFQKSCLFMGSILQGKFVHVKMNKYHFLTKIVHAFRDQVLDTFHPK
jgi:hypothetical protein